MNTNFNNVVGVNDNQTVNVVVEIPKGSNLKIEWDRKKGYFILDRLESTIFTKPVNYGFVPQTLDEDGDELDVLILAEQPMPMGLVLPEAKVIGILNFIDDDEEDHKLICIPADNRDQSQPQRVEEIDQIWKNQIEHHFNHCKDLKKPGSTKVLGFGDQKQAWQVIETCQKRAQAEPWW